MPFRTQLHRIRGRTLRTESLDRSNARDLAQVVRILREVDVSPVSPSSTTGCEAPERKWLLRAQLHRIRGRMLRTESLDRSNASDLAQVVRLLREVDVSPVSPSSTSQDVSIIYQLLFINKKTQYTL